MPNRNPISGIYSIENLRNGNCYIGSALHIPQRWQKHKKDLCNGIHHSRYLQRAWNKHGADAFIFKTLFLCKKEQLLFYEQRTMDLYQSKYNVCKVAGSAIGVKRTKETLEKVSRGVSIALTGKKRKPFTHEHKENLSLAHKGKNTGKRPAYVGQKISAAKMGKKAITAPEVEAERRRKISLATKGRPWPEARLQAHLRMVRGENRKQMPLFMPQVDYK